MVLIFFIFIYNLFVLIFFFVSVYVYRLDMFLVEINVLCGGKGYFICNILYILIN